MGTKKEAVILFADIIGCSQISNAITIEAYANFLKQFHSACRNSFEALQKIPKLTMKKPDECELYIKGDECCVFLHKTQDNKKEIEWAIRFALALQLNWLISEHNLNNVRQGIPPVELGIGIHQGLVYYDDFQQVDKSSEGFCINLAKRIEGISREGKMSKIYLSEQAYLKFADALRLQTKFSNPEPRIMESQLKGINTPIQVRELNEADRELFEEPSKQISSQDIAHLKFCASALPNTDWLKFLVRFLFAEKSSIPAFIRDIRSNIVDNLGIQYWLNDAKYYMDQKDYSQAEEKLKEALSIASKGESFDTHKSAINETITLYARLYFERGTFKESIALASKAINNDRYDLQAYYYLIESLYRTKQYESCRCLTAEVKGLNLSMVLPDGVKDGYFWFKDAEMLCELYNDKYKEEVEKSLKCAFKKNPKWFDHIENNNHLRNGLKKEELLKLNK